MQFLVLGSGVKENVGGATSCINVAISSGKQFWLKLFHGLNSARVKQLHAQGVAANQYIVVW